VIRSDSDSAATLTLRTRGVPGPHVWDEWCANHSGTTPFHHWGWLNSMADALGTRFLPLGFYQGKTLVGLAPMLVKQYGPYKNANWAPFPYLSPLVPRRLFVAALQALDVYQSNNRIGLIQLVFTPSADVDVAALTATGYTVHNDTTMMIPLAGRSVESLWAGMTSHGRKNYKRATRAGVTVTSSTEEEIKKDLVEILHEVFEARHQPSPYPAKAAALVWDRYHDDPRVRMVTAHYAGQVAAVSISVSDRTSAMLWQGASRRQYRTVNPNALLYWDAICWAQGRGCAVLDMTGNPDSGIAYYKSTFGSVEARYVVARRQNTWWASQVRAAHTALTSLRYQAPDHIVALRHHVQRHLPMRQHLIDSRLLEEADVQRPPDGKVHITRPGVL